MIALLQLLLTLGLSLLLLVSTGSFLLHFFSTRNNPDSPQSTGESYLKAFLSETVATLFHGLLWPFGWLPTPSQSHYIEAGGPPIVLLPGTLGTRGNLMPLYWRLESAGYHNVYLHNLSPFNGSLEKQAHSLHQHLDTISRLTHGKPLHIVAFGSSGLVLRVLLDSFPNLPVKRIITLGCAHQGTQLEVFNPGPHANQRHYQSAYLQNLRPLLVPVTTITSTLDQFILPPHQRSTPSEKPEKWIEFNNTGHFQLFYSPKVIAKILHELPPASTLLEHRETESPETSSGTERNEP